MPACPFDGCREIFDLDNYIATVIISLKYDYFVILFAKIHGILMLSLINRLEKISWQETRKIQPAHAF